MRKTKLDGCKFEDVVIACILLLSLPVSCNKLVQFRLG